MLCNWKEPMAWSYDCMVLQKFDIIIIVIIINTSSSSLLKVHVMVAYCRVYGFGHLQADCLGQEKASEILHSNWVWDYLYLYCYISVKTVTSSQASTATDM